MTTFKIRNPGETQAVEPLPTLDELKQAKRPEVEILLVSLGYILTAEEETTEWMDLGKIARLSKKHWAHVPRLACNRKADLRLMLAAYFEKNADVNAAGLQISVKQERVGDHRDQDFFIRFRKLPVLPLI